MATPIGKSSEPPITVDYISKLPKVIQTMLGPYLGADLSQISQVSGLFQKIMSDPTTWMKVAQSYNLTVKDPKNAKKEVMELLNSVNTIALACLGQDEAKEISKDKDTFALNHDLEELFKKDEHAQKLLQTINDQIINFGDFPSDVRKKLTDPDPFKVHREIIQYIRSHAASLQENSIIMLNSILHACKESNRYWDLGIKAALVLVKNGMVGEKGNSRGATEYWTEALKIALGWQSGFALALCEPLYEGVLEQFKKADIPENDKGIVLNNVFRKYIKDPVFEQAEPMTRLVALAEPDETTLQVAMERSVKMGKLFIDHSHLSKEKLLKILHNAEITAANQFDFYLEEIKAKAMFNELREYINSRS